MANDDTRGRRGGDNRGGRNDRPGGGFQKRGDSHGGPPRRDAAPRDRNPWQNEGGAQGGGQDKEQGEGQAWRPFRSPAPRDEGRPPFQSRERTFGGDRDRGPGGRPPFRGGPGGDRPPFRGGQGGDRPPFRSGPGGDRPPFRGGQGGDRPPFRGGQGGDRPPFRGQDSDRPASRDDRGEGGRPPFRDRDDAPGGDRPTYRQGRGGYRSFDQDLGRPERPPFQERRPEGDRPAFQDRKPEGDRPFQGRRPEGDRPFQSRRPEGDRPGYQGRRPEGDRPGYQGRRPDGDRPQFQERRPFAGGRPFERRESGNSLEQGRPLGTSTRAGRSPVSQFERIQADVYGRWPVLESLRAGNVQKVYLAAGVKDSADHLQEIQTIAAERHVTVVRVDRFDLDRVLGNVNHQGIAAACRPFQYTSFDDVVAASQNSGEKPLLVLFDGVQDPQNLGSILRTAEAVGVDGAVLPKHNQAGITPAVVRASAGAVEHLPIAEVTNLRQSIATLKEAGYWIVGLDMEGGTDYDNFDVDSPVALIVGGEGHGLNRMVSEECDYLVRLPMRGRIGSLNASVAAGIVLYEIGRRRGTAGTPKAAKAAIAPNTEITEVVEPDDEDDVDDEDLALELELEIEEEDFGDTDAADEDLPDDKVEGDEIQAPSLDSEDVVDGVEGSAKGVEGAADESHEAQAEPTAQHEAEQEAADQHEAELESAMQQDAGSEPAEQHNAEAPEHHEEPGQPRGEQA
ncbi:MAG: rRNA methylase [Chloroflexi bacterium]|nr:rRNA methylase [Chloroflexota bacterium]